MAHSSPHQHQHPTESHPWFEDKASDWDNKPINKGTTELVKKWITSQPWWSPPLDGPALDFGCGTGNLTMAIRDGLGDKITGVDTSRAMLEQFERKAEGQGVSTVAVELTGPGQLGQGADASFALIYTCLALHHIRDCERAVSALAHYLRPGGRLVVFDMEATDGAPRFHPSHFELGKELEHHGIREADLRAWCEGTGILKDLSVERLPFRKEDGENGAFGTGSEFIMLAFSCVREASDGASAAVGAGASWDEACLACSRREVEYECVPCGCHAFCKTCAMKVATGGRCKKCKDMFTDLKRLR